MWYNICAETVDTRGALLFKSSAGVGFTFNQITNCRAKHPSLGGLTSRRLSQQHRQPSEGCFVMYKSCEVCNKEYKIKASAYHKSSYCSKECRIEGYKVRFKGIKNPNYKNSGWRTCQYCKQQYFHYSKVRKYCSKECDIADKAALSAARLSNPPLCACGCGQPVKWNVRKGTWRKVIGRHRVAKVRKDSNPKRKDRLVINLPKANKPKRGTFSLSCKSCGVIFEWKTPHKIFCPDCNPTVRNRNNPNCTCVICKKQFYNAYKPKTCSKECKQAWWSLRQKGEKSHRWKGGRTSAVARFRKSLEYDLWRESVFTRDDFTCQMCNDRGGRLAAHHIKLFSLHPELALEVSNGITLCWPCHRSIKSKEAEYEDRFYEITKRPGNTTNARTGAISSRMETARGYRLGCRGY